MPVLVQSDRHLSILYLWDNETGSACIFFVHELVLVTNEIIILLLFEILSHFDDQRASSIISTPQFWTQNRRLIMSLIKHKHFPLHPSVNPH